MSLPKCNSVRTSKEGYTYTRNQPKNESQIILNSFSENYTYTSNQPKNQSQLALAPVENYNYGYNYAMYKPVRHEKMPSEQIEQKWSGVI